MTALWKGKTYQDLRALFDEKGIKDLSSHELLDAIVCIAASIGAFIEEEGFNNSGKEILCAFREELESRF